MELALKNKTFLKEALFCIFCSQLCCNFLNFMYRHLKKRFMYSHEKIYIDVVHAIKSYTDTAYGDVKGGDRSLLY